jgi:CRP/FNR family transcriptional regulator
MDYIFKIAGTGAMPTKPRRPGGPLIRAIDPCLPGNPGEGIRHQILSDYERAQLARISSVVRFTKGERIYNEGEPADAAFNIVSGAVTAYREFSEHRQHTAAFLYPGDIFGLSEQGRYTNAARATTAVVAYKIPMLALRRLLASNPGLDTNIIIKLCDELRQAQHHAFLLAQKKATSKLAMFLGLHEHLQNARGDPISEIYFPMDRTDIAEYLGLTPAAVSRAFRALTCQKLISCRDRQHVKVLDKSALEGIANIKHYKQVS